MLEYYYPHVGYYIFRAYTRFQGSSIPPDSVKNFKPCMIDVTLSGGVSDRPIWGTGF